MKKELLRDVIYILQRIDELGKEYYCEEYFERDFNISYERLEKALKYVKNNNLLDSFSCEYSDDSIEGFLTEGISSKGERFLKDNKVTTKIYNVVKSVSDIIK